MRTNLETAQEIFKDIRYMDTDYVSAFNCRILGEPNHSQVCGYPNPQHTYGARSQGFYRANKMIMDGDIYYRHIFPHEGCNELSFSYGGSQVCNSCGRNNLQKDWWVIRVFKDGDAWCCVGENFENLQESDNYAFGSTRDEAINNYALLYKQPTKGKER